MAIVNFFYQDTSFKLKTPRKSSSWIKAVIEKEKGKLCQLNYIFCSDEYLRRINTQYLNHKTYTDIITFDNSGNSSEIEGDIFISIERVTDNAKRLKVDFETELHRVLIHGVLHLFGYTDKNPTKEREMRKKEDAYLSLRQSN